MTSETLPSIICRRQPPITTNQTNQSTIPPTSRPTDRLTGQLTIRFMAQSHGLDQRIGSIDRGRKSMHGSDPWIRFMYRTHRSASGKSRPQGRSRFLKVSQGLTRLRKMLILTGSHKVRRCSSSQRFTKELARSHEVSEGPTRSHKVSQGVIWHHKAPQGLTRSHKVSQGLTRAHMWYIFSIKASRDHCHLSGKGSSASILELRRLMKKI